MILGNRFGITWTKDDHGYSAAAENSEGETICVTLDEVTGLYSVDAYSGRGDGITERHIGQTVGLHRAFYLAAKSNLDVELNYWLWTETLSEDERKMI